MKGRINILYILIPVIYLLVNSCSSGASKNESTTEFVAEEINSSENVTTLEYEFEKDEVSSLGLEAFNSRAIQKVDDLADYIAIISDTSVEAEFIDQAKIMLLAMFVEKSDISVASNSNNKTQQIKLKDFINSIEQPRAEAYSLKFENASTIKAISKVKRQSYRGMIKCTLISSSPIIINKTTLPKSNYKTEIEIIVKKISKSFGDTKKDIWEVFLGDIFLTMEE